MIAYSEVKFEKIGIETGVEALRLLDEKRYELEKCGYQLGFTTISVYKGRYSVRAEFQKQEELSCG